MEVLSLFEWWQKYRGMVEEQVGKVVEMQWGAVNPAESTSLTIKTEYGTTWRLQKQHLDIMPTADAIKL